VITRWRPIGASFAWDVLALQLQSTFEAPTVAVGGQLLLRGRRHLSCLEGSWPLRGARKIPAVRGTKAFLIPACLPFALSAWRMGAPKGVFGRR